MFHNQTVEQGRCICQLEPKGKHGLEGYQEGDSYRFEQMSADRNGNPYYRVYPTELDKSYYETCSKSVFRRYFRTGQ